VVDIPFTRKIRDVLLEERLAEQHHMDTQFRLEHVSNPPRRRCTARLQVDTFVLCALPLAHRPKSR
jgi:hypothetical protein